MRVNRDNATVGVALPRVVKKLCYIGMAAAVPLEDGGILQSFWGLASTDETERLDSARDLLTALSKKQVSGGGSSESGI